MVLCRLSMVLGIVVLLGGEPAAQLPPEMQADRYLMQAERYIESGDYAAAKAALDHILALQAEHDMALPTRPGRGVGVGALDRCVSPPPLARARPPAL